MNVHTDDFVMARVMEHLEEAKRYFNEDSIVGIFLQGSQNYGLDYEGSDIDTKLIVCPTFKEIAFNKKPISTTHVMENNEHIDFKDIRLYINEFRKQNINFLEILFTPYCWINPKYEPFWNTLIRHRESIARYDTCKAIASMKGMSHEKFAQMEKVMPHNAEVIEQYGYEPKQLSHIMRLEDFMERYIELISFANCLIPARHKEILQAKLGTLSLEKARDKAAISLAHIDEMATKYRDTHEQTTNDFVDNLLDNVQEGIMRESLITELGVCYDY